MNEYPRAGLDLVDSVAEDLGVWLFPNLRLRNATDGLHRAQAGLPVRVPRLGDRLQGALELPLAHRHAGERRLRHVRRRRAPVRGNRAAARRALAASASADRSRRASASASSRVRTSPAKAASSTARAGAPPRGPARAPAPRSGRRRARARADGRRCATRAPRGPARARASRWLSTRLVARARAAGREPVGHGQHRHLDLDRLARAHVPVHVPARQRLLVHEEPEVQVVLRQRGDEVRERGARVHAPAEGARQVGAHAVVTPEEHAALVGDRARRRLAGVVEQGAEPQRLPAGELVASGCASSRAMPSPDSPSTAAGSPVTSTTPLEHLERVTPHVQVVVRVLLDSLQRLELGQQTRPRARSSPSARSRAAASGPATSRRSS